MWRSPVTTSAAAGEPLSLEDAKAQLRVDGTTEDDLVGDLIAVARAHVESRTGTRLVTQTVTVRTDDWNDLERLPIGPVQSITSVSYVDTDGEAQTVSADVYEARLEGLEPSLATKYMQTWPQSRSGSLVTVTAVVGYGAAGSQPPETIHAIRLILSDLYAHRETVGEGVSLPVAASVDALLANHSIHLI